MQELKAKLRTAIRRQHTARNVTLRDKTSFVIGTTLAMCAARPLTLVRLFSKVEQSQGQAQQETLPCRLSAYWLGYSPATFNRRIYTWAAIILFTLRYVIYRVKKWHYYGESGISELSFGACFWIRDGLMLQLAAVYDFCYLANVLLLVHIWFIPHSAFLHKVRV